MKKIYSSKIVTTIKIDIYLYIFIKHPKNSTIFYKLYVLLWKVLTRNGYFISVQIKFFSFKGRINKVTQTLLLQNLHSKIFEIKSN